VIDKFETDTGRRSVMKAGIVAAIASATPFGSQTVFAKGARMTTDTSSWTLEQPKLPYADDALAPVISAETISYHYGKHHAAYFGKARDMVKGTPLEGKSLETVVMAAHKEGAKALFNNAAQAWNHNFYWESLTPKKQMPDAKLKAAIERDFGSMEKLNDELEKVTTGQFGSGWGWLVSDKGRLKVVSTSNAGVPLTDGLTPLLTIDVWEHAYYLDHQNKRPDYVKALVSDHLAWDFASANYAA